MADTKTTNAPAPASAPAATPTPAPAPAATAPRSKPAAAPAPTNSPKTPSIAPVKQRPVLTARKALGLDEEPRESIQKETKRMRGNLEATTRITELNETPAPAPTPEPLPDLPASGETPTAVVEPTPAPVAPAKIKIGDKEYTAEELVAENTRLAEAAKKAATPPAQVQEEPAPAPVPQLTKEEVAKREAQFVATTAAALEAPISEEEMDTILAGGKDAVSLLTKIRQRDMATAILQARKGVADILNPIFDKIFNTLAPLEQQHQQLQVYNIEQAFMSKHKDFAPHHNVARQVAEELAKRYPQQVAKMTQEQFIDEVARQSDVILSNDHRRWFPNENGNWRKGSTSPSSTTPATPAPATPAAPTAPAAPAPERRAARAPAATSPTAAGSTAGAIPWGKSVAATLRG